MLSNAFITPLCAQHSTERVQVYRNETTFRERKKKNDEGIEPLECTPAVLVIQKKIVVSLYLKVIRKGGSDLAGA